MSSISPLSSVMAVNTTDAQNDPRALFKQLAKDINSGNLAAAQKDYASISNAQQGALSKSPLGTDFSLIGDALKSGDIQGAQTALATMQADAKKLGHGHHHHHHAPEATATDSTTAQSSSTDPLVGAKLNVLA